MKNLTRSIVVCAFTLLMFANAGQAQATQFTVTGGHLDIVLDPGYLNYLADNGITVTYPKIYVEHGGLKVTSGDLDKTTGTGEVHSSGRITLTSGAMKVELMGLTVDSSNPAYPTIDAMICVNGIYQGRFHIFTVISGVPYTLPLSEGKNITRIGFLKGAKFTDYFQLLPAKTNPLAGSYSLTLSLEK